MDKSKTRTCNKCNKELPLNRNYFIPRPHKKIKNGKVIRIMYYNRTCSICKIGYLQKPYSKPNKKVCGTCKKTFPNTRKYFFKRLSKHKRVSGEIIVNISTRSTCKKCHSANTLKKQRIKRCKELNCSIEELDTISKEITRLNSFKIKGTEYLNHNERTDILRRVSQGYVFTTLEQWYKDKPLITKENKKITSLNHRKYDYGDADFVTSKMSNDMARKHLAKSIVANTFQIPVIELDDKTYNLYKKYIMLYRSIKSLNY